MKILLINPPRSNENKILEYASEEAKYFIHKKLIGPPLGLLTIAAAIKDYDVTVLEMKGEYDLNPDAPEPKQLVMEYLNAINPDIVGVTVITSEFDASIQIFRTVKEYDAKILTVAGGLHATLCPNDFRNKSVDIVVPGQCAHVFREIVEAKEKKILYESLHGIMITSGENLLFTKQVKTKWDPVKKNYIIPDRSFLKRWLTTYRVGKNRDLATYLFTSLGCPYKCSFCSIWPQLDGGYYKRDIESIVDELKMLDEYQIIRFADANTIVDYSFINKLFDRIKEEGIKKEYVMDIRFDVAASNPKLIEKLARSGLKVVICGFESFREEELKRYQKSSSSSLIEKAIEVFQANGIMLRGNYVIPNYYIDDDFKALSEYASKHRVVYAGYTILTPMPGTKFYDEIKDQIIDFDFSKYNFFNCVLKTKLPIEKFYENVGKLWLIKKGTDII